MNSGTVHFDFKDQIIVNCTDHFYACPFSDVNSLAVQATILWKNCKKGCKPDESFNIISSVKRTVLMSEKQKKNNNKNSALNSLQIIDHVLC